MGLWVQLQPFNHERGYKDIQINRLFVLYSIDVSQVYSCPHYASMISSIIEVSTGKHEGIIGKCTGIMENFFGKIGAF